MNNNMILSVAMSVIPILAIAFVCALLMQKLYFRIRSRYGVKVNCWFCNQNTKVPYTEANSWTCQQCEQYNGFTKDGDYNREIFQQLDCSNLTDGRATDTDADDVGDLFTRLPPKNGFCNMCNEAQRLKVEKLAQFEPKNESHFDAELRVYKAQLEEQYRLCSTCDRHLKKVLREKKKMVLGSKFLDFIIKGAETLKQPHFNRLRHAQKQQWKQRLTTIIALLTLINVCCLLSALPSVRREHYTRYLGDRVGQFVFLALSHVLAFGRVLYAYVETLTQHESVQKCVLFVRTIFMMLLYSLGLKLPQLVRINFASLYVFGCPFAILASAFAYNIVDGFRLTQFTFLLLLWSTLAGGLVGDFLWLSQNTLLLLASLVTIVLLWLRKETSTSQLHDSSASSFHKIYSEDYLSDEDTISLLSQQLNSSAASICSMNASRSFSKPTLSPAQYHPAQCALPRSPLTSSVLSLHTQPATGNTSKQISPNTSFQSFRTDIANTNNANTALRSNYAASMCNFPTVSQRAMSPHSTASLFASNLELSCRERPMSTTRFGMSAYAGEPHASYGNASTFMQPPRSQAHYGHNSDEHLTFPTAAGAAAMRNGQGHGMTATPMHSPFSVSSGAVYQQQPPLHYDIHRSTPATNLLSPSRFSTHSLAGGMQSVGASWLSGGYFNANTQSTQRLLYEPSKQQTRNVMGAIDENLSRASSQSSGFESQTGRLFGGGNGAGAGGGGIGYGGSLGGGLNRSRENSYGATETLDANMLDGNGPSAFKPVEAPRRSNGFDNNWNAPPARKALHASDSFNLRRINEELPNIRRGDLLKKWKEGQTQTAATAS